MLKTAYDSLAFRSGRLYQWLLRAIPQIRRKKTVSPGIVMITLCGKNHIDMLKQSLQSLLISFTEIPEITIYSDGTLSTEALQKKLSAFKDFVKISHWQDCKKGEDEKLVEFANKHPIGRKLLVITHNAKLKPTLWWDTDILWFKGISQLHLPKENQGFYIKTSEDYQPAYSKNMLSAFDKFAEKPFVNTGLVYLSGTLLNNGGSNDLLEIAAEAPDHFSEQTILGKAVKLSGSNTWSLDTIACQQNDQLTLAPTYVKKRWVARHYVGPVRHLFWRDAFFLRMGVKA